MGRTCNILWVAERILCDISMTYTNFVLKSWCSLKKKDHHLKSVTFRPEIVVFSKK